MFYGAFSKQYSHILYFRTQSYSECSIESSGHCLKWDKIQILILEKGKKKHLNIKYKLLDNTKLFEFKALSQYCMQNSVCCLR